RPSARGNSKSTEYRVASTGKFRCLVALFWFCSVLGTRDSLLSFFLRKHLEHDILRVRRDFLVRVAHILCDRAFEHEISVIPRILPLTAFDRSFKIKRHSVDHFCVKLNLFPSSLALLKNWSRNSPLSFSPSPNRETNPVTCPASSTVTCTNSPSF